MPFSLTNACFFVFRNLGLLLTNKKGCSIWRSYIFVQSGMMETRSIRFSSWFRPELPLSVVFQRFLDFIYIHVVGPILELVVGALLWYTMTGLICLPGIHCHTFEQWFTLVSLWSTKCPWHGESMVCDLPMAYDATEPPGITMQIQSICPGMRRMRRWFLPTGPTATSTTTTTTPFEPRLQGLVPAADRIGSHIFTHRAPPFSGEIENQFKSQEFSFVSSVILKAICHCPWTIDL